MRLIWVGLQMLAELMWVWLWGDGGAGLTSLLNWKSKSLQAGAEEDGGGQEGRKVCPLRGEVILQSSPPYTHSHSHTEVVCRCAGWCSHAKKDECLRNENKHWNWACLCVCSCMFFFTYLMLNIFLNSFYNERIKLHSDFRFHVF